MKQIQREKLKKLPEKWQYVIWKDQLIPVPMQEAMISKINEIIERLNEN